MVALPGPFVEDRALAHLACRPCVLGLGRELIDPSRFKRDVQGVGAGQSGKERERDQGEDLEGGWIGVHVVPPFI